ncbi:hypothetical protein K9M74_00395 [Candidatus Woesearchaeota archaeon]|nr:hypothetical protein [Candidatus Woesearchaeota archaeon]
MNTPWPFPTAATADFPNMTLEDILALSLEEPLLSVAWNFMTDSKGCSSAFLSPSLAQARQELIAEFEAHRRYLVYDESSSLRFYEEIVQEGGKFTSLAEAKERVAQLEATITHLEDADRWIKKLASVNLGHFTYEEKHSRSLMETMVYDVADFAKLFFHASLLGSVKERQPLQSVEEFQAAFFEQYTHALWRDADFAWYTNTIPKETSFPRIEAELKKLYETITQAPDDAVFITKGYFSSFFKKPKELHVGDFEEFEYDAKTNELVYSLQVPSYRLGVKENYPCVLFDDKKNSFVGSNVELYSRNEAKEYLTILHHEYKEKAPNGTLTNKELAQAVDSLFET